jgi:signal transduction histidine kinase
MGMPLRFRLVMASATLLLVTCSPLALWLPGRMDSLSMRWMESQAVGISRALASATGTALAFDDRSAAASEIDGLSRTPGAVYAELVRVDGRRLAAWGEIPRSRPAPAMTEQVIYGDGLLHVAVPAETRAGFRGTLLTGFSLAEVQARGRQTRFLVGGVAMSILVFGLLGTWLLVTFMLRPLGLVTVVAQRIAAGDEAAVRDLPSSTRDEIGAMTAALGRTFEELRQQRARAAEANRELAAVVEDRTVELVRTNVALADLRLAQEQLVVADRRASLGQLAAGIGHEINNPLAYVIGNLEWVREELKAQRAALVKVGGTTPEDDDRLDAMSAALRDSSEGAARIKGIVAQLQTFSTGDVDDRLEPVRVTDALNVALGLLGHELKHRARLKRVDRVAPAVRANLVQLSQVLVHLLVNAAQSIPEAAADVNEIRAITGTDAQGRAFVEIQDSGSGISKEDRARIFTPFFTTKPVGQGTGLGLSVSLGIVRRLGGDITFESALGAGSRFRVVLPPCAELPITPAAAPPECAPRPTRGAKILVVDDDLPVAAVLARRLARRYQPTTATSGAEALDLIAKGARFDVIVCDLMMPSMNGMELYSALTAAAPDQAARMIFVTGGAFTEAGNRFLEMMSGCWLYKPVDVARLEQLVEARLA